MSDVLNQRASPRLSRPGDYPSIDRTYPLARLREAMRRLETGTCGESSSSRSETDPVDARAANVSENDRRAVLTADRDLKADDLFAAVLAISRRYGRGVSGAARSARGVEWGELGRLLA